MHGDAELPAPYLPVLHELVDDLARHVNGNGKADPDIGPGRPDDGRVNADELTAKVDERTARIPWIDRCIGLNEILIALDAKA